RTTSSSKGHCTATRPASHARRRRDNIPIPTRTCSTTSRNGQTSGSEPLLREDLMKGIAFHWPRGRTHALGAAAGGLALLLAAATLHAAPAATGDIAGMWWASTYSPSMKTYLVGGGDIPLNDAGKKKYAEIQAGLKDGSITDRARKYCTPDGLPRSLATDRKSVV